jgi:hypothetical protein
MDHNYLSLQFWIKIHEKTGTEFQSFFEDLMEKAFLDFQRVRPYGNKGDGGNDGYRPGEGIYYQVYAPKNPSEKEVEAAKKLKEDFEKLMTSGWDQISKIKEYRFAFNDKKCGVSMEIEKALAELKKDNPSIQFNKLTPKDLEEIFFDLDEKQLLSLGFDVDSTKAVTLARESLEKLEVYLDRENGEFVEKALANLKDIIEKLHDENLELDYGILECRTLAKLEKRVGAKEKYESICTRYPKDIRAFLYWAEICIDDMNFEKNEELLEKAKKIDDSYWLFELEKLIRDLRLGNKFDAKNIDEKTFPSEPTIKSHFYRVYAIILEQLGDQERADSFIERAIKLNPDKFNNYNAKLSILIGRAQGQKDREVSMKEVETILPEFDIIEQKVAEWGNLNARNRAMLNVKKMRVFLILENVREIDKLAPETFELLLECYFDSIIDEALVELLIYISLPEDDLKRLLEYLKNADNKFSDSLEKTILIQFLHKNTLLTEGKAFFEESGRKKALEFIDSIENKKYDQAWDYLKDELRFAVAIANSAKDFPDLRRKIIENLPDDGSIQKEKLLLLLNYDEKNTDEAFDLLKGFDLSNLSYFECRPILEIAQEKNAWDFVAKILEQLLQYEKDEKLALQLKLQLFTANLNLGKFTEVISIGEEILSNTKEVNLLDDQNKEIVLGQTLWARMKRSEYAEAKELLEKQQEFSETFEFKVAVEAEVYLKNKEAEKALDSIVSGIRVLKTPTPEEYGRLFIFFTELGGLIDFQLVALDKVEVNCFVKLKGQERWYFIGNEEGLDATKITPENERHSLFLDKKVGDKVVFDEKYSSRKEEHTIENILPIEKYILWQCMHHAQELSMQRRWDMMEMIEVPTTGDGIDPQYLIAKMEDIKKSRGDFFDLYCEQNIPLAFLALNQGGLTDALGCIINENKGFVKFSSGDLGEINQQKEVAKRIIDGQTFYMDGTSALVLSETGNLEKILQYMPNLKIPQSVITLLLETKEKFRYSAGQTGHLGYAQGKLRFSSVDQNKRDRLQDNFATSIKLLESNPDNIEVISNASKMDCFSEQKIPPELSDACILAQKEETPVLTEDFLYLKANELETKKKAPEYCSTFALMRVLYEEGKISFDDYLTYFAYLSSYRFRFLPLNIDDISKAVFGDGTITTITPEKIRQLNFPLTLSEEYGVSFETSFMVVGKFVIRLLMDDAVLPEIAERIFIEILDTFPTDKGKKALGQMFIRASVQTINKANLTFTVGTRTQEKIDRLIQVTELYR